MNRSEIIQPLVLGCRTWRVNSRIQLVTGEVNEIQDIVSESNRGNCMLICDSSSNKLSTKDSAFYSGSHKAFC
jgi:hypothetical protein